MKNSILEIGEVRKRQKNATLYLTGECTLPQALGYFQEFATYCTAEKRWFFRNGKPLKLAKDTPYVRLLPPIKGYPGNERLLICIYPAADNEDASLHLLKWVKQQDTATISVASPSPHPIDFSELPEHTTHPHLNGYPRQIWAQPGFGKSFMLELVYRTGRVEIVANEYGIRDARWVPDAPGSSEEPIRLERSSCGTMPPILGMKSRYDDGWCDNLLFDADSQAIEVGNVKVGIIKGADSAGPNTPEGVWFCNNLARACFWQPGLGKPLESGRLGGIGHDILNIPVPKRYEENSESAVLIPAGDGRVYILGKQKGEARITVQGHQAMEQHILRLIGDSSDNEVLAVDTNQTIHPIQIDMADHITRDMSQLAEKLVTDLQGRFQPDSWETTPEGIQAFGQQFFPILICNLLGLATPDPETMDNVLIVANDFFSSYHQLRDTENIISLADIHNQLLTYLWGWLQGQTEGKTVSSQLSDLLRILLDLPDEAPDILWLSLFRHYPLLQRVYLASNLDTDPLPWLTELQQRIIVYRGKFNPVIENIRQIQMTSSHYLPIWTQHTQTQAKHFPGQARHLRILDKEHVCFVDYREGLQAWKISLENESRQWECIWSKPHDEDWYGLPCSLLAGPLLNKALYGHDDGEKRILLTTNRGEIRLYSVASLKPLLTKQVEQDIRYVEPFDYAGCHGLILAGQNPKRQASLTWLHLSPDKRSFQDYSIWNNTMDPIGSIRMLETRCYNKQRILLWGVDQERGRLHQWEVRIHPSSTRIFLYAGKIILDKQRQLYTLDATPDSLQDGRRPILICGGVNGQVFGIDPDTSQIKWMIGCGKTIKRTVYLAASDEWLVCGEYSTVFIVRSNNGKITGLLENIGPISTARSFDELPESPQNPFLILSGRHGRLMLLKATEPCQHHPKDFDILYPLSGKGTPPLHGAPETGHYPDFLLGQEILIFKHYLRCRGNHSPLTNSFKTFLQRQPSSRLAWWLYQDTWKQDNLPHAADYLKCFWDIAKTRGNVLNDTPCQIVTALLRTPKLNGLDHLRNNILHCLWSGPQDDACPEGFWREERIHGLRLGLAAWLYHRAQQENPTRPIESEAFINAWLNQLWHWLPGRMQTMEGLHKALVALLEIHNSSYLLGSQEWFKWLQPSSHGDSPPIPSLLGELQKASKLQLPLQNKHLLGKLFPTPEWANWVQKYIQVTDSIDALEKNRPRILWKEYQSLGQLIVLFSTAQRIFTPANKIPLFALWHDRNLTKIREAIQKQMRWREQMPLIATYIPIDVAVKWHNANLLDLHFKIKNHYCKDLTLASITLPASPQYHEQQVFTQAQILPARDIAAEFTWPGVRTLARDILYAHNLALELKETDTGTLHRLHIEVDFRRCIRTFNEEPRWQETWIRLEKLLRNHETTGQVFIWIEGHYWPDAERERLKVLIKNQYQVEVGVQIPAASCLGKALAMQVQCPQPVTYFCPDIPLGETEPCRLVDAFHTALHDTDLPHFQYWAFWLWRSVKHLPAPINNALEKLPAKREVSTLLESVGITGETLRRLKEGIDKIPLTAIGDWCAGEPVYAEKWRDAQTDWYTTPYLYFPAEIWRILAIGSNANMEGLNAWLQPKAERRLQESDLPYLDDAKQHDETKLISRLTTALAGQRSRKYHTFWECANVSPPLTVLDDDYEYIYLFTSPITDGERKQLNHHIHRSAICLVFTDEPLASIPSDGENNHLKYFRLPAPMLRTMALAARHEQLALLNQIAATQRGIATDKIFRTVGGMSERGLKRHFYGRKSELDKLFNMLASGHGGYVIIGGRRVGKTSLRQYFANRLTATDRERPCLVINCEKVKLINGPALDKWLVSELVGQLKAGGWLADDTVVWPKHGDTQELPHQQALEARHHLEKHLRAFKKRPVIILDETEHLLRRDTNLHILNWLRALVTEHVTHLLLTSYPHGKQHQHSLPSLIKDAGTPFYNFLEALELTAWSPQETWQFIHSKLQLAGINLPLDLRSSVLNLTRGIPWIVHYVGQLACTHVQHGIVTEAHWQRIRDSVISEIHNNLRETVQNVAESHDRTHGSFDRETRTGTMQKALWPALASITKQRNTELPLSNSTTWPTETEFTDEDVLEYYQIRVSLHHLREVLSQFTGTGVLRGHPTDPHRFSFAHNLLPLVASCSE